MTAGFYHCSVKGIGRSKGRSVVAAAAYRSGERLTDERTGETFDYRARGGVQETFILAPDHAPDWAHERGQLWSRAELAETRSNGRLATEIELALPHELTDAQRHELVEEFLRPIIERHNVAADAAIHVPGEGRDHRNVHAHVLITHRELGPDGFGGIANEHTITKKVKGQAKEIKVAGIANSPADIRAIRKGWEQSVNRAYERAGLDVRVDHRSHKDRGIEQEPTKHLGPKAAEMERRGEESERGAINRDIHQRNAERQDIRAIAAEERKLAAEITQLKAERAAQTEAAPDREESIEIWAQHRATERAAREMEHAAGDALDVGSRTTGKMFGGLAKAVENLLGGIFGLFVAETPLSPMQAELAVQAAAEDVLTQEIAAAQRDEEALKDWVVWQHDRQQQIEEHERAVGHRDRESDRERERERQRY